MTFLHATLAAAGIACIAIPIIIHLLMHRRRKPVMWGAMRFLLEAYRRQRRRLMLEKWLLLLCRCLVLALLALALGRPLLGTLGGEKSGRTLYLLIDNGLTSALKADGDQGRTALDRHKESAKAAIAALRAARGPGGALGEGDRVGLIAMGGPADGLVVPPSADLAALGAIIDEIQPTDSRTDFSGAMQIVADNLSPNTAETGAGTTVPDPKRTYVAVFSDFREGSLELSPGNTGGGAVAAGVRLPAGVTLTATRPAQGGSGTNITIAGVEPLRSVVVAEGGDQTGADLARVHLRRSGGDLAAATSTITARVVAAGPEGTGAADKKGAVDAAGRATVKWSAGQDAAMTVVSIPRPQNSGAATARGAACVLVVTIDNDSLPRDNTWRRPVEFRESLKVGVVGPTRFASAGADKLDPAAWARLALSPAGEAAASGIEVVDIEPASVDAARLAGLDALVLPRPDLLQDSSWVRIGLFLSSGGVVVVTPPPSVTVHLWTDAMIKGLGLPGEWTLPRESRTFEGARLVAEAGAPAPGDGGGNGAGEAKTGSLLSLVQSEMDQLLRPVNIRAALPLESTGDIGNTLLRLENGPTILWAGRPGTSAGTAGPDRRNEPGLLVYLGVALSLDWSDLPAKPLMVPLMQEAIRQGVGEARGAWWSVAGSRPTAPARTVELRELATGEAAPAGAEHTGGSVALNETGAVVSPLRRAGAFRAVDERGATRALVAVNPDVRGSRIAAQTIEAVGKQLGTAVVGDTPTEAKAEGGGAVVWIPGPGGLGADTVATGPATPESVQRTFAGMFGSGPKGSPIDLPLLLAALALAAVEVGLARWASHADVRSAGGAGAVVAAVSDEGRAAA